MSVNKDRETKQLVNLLKHQASSLYVKKKVVALYWMTQNTWTFREWNLLSDKLKCKLYESFIKVILVEANLQRNNA